MSEQQHRLVIAGSMDEFIALAQTAKKRGYYVIVCDGYPDGPAKKIADKAYTIDVRDVDAFAEMCKTEHADGIIGSFSDLLFEQITKIADKANLRWYATPDKLNYYRERDRTKALMKELGVHVPKNKKLESDFSDADLAGFEFPLVIKPVNGYGSKGIYVVHSVDEIREKFEDVVCRSSGVRTSILVEEYSHGREYNMMSWIVDGKVYPISLADREKNPQTGDTLPLLNRVVYPAKAIHQILDEAREVQQKFADAVGQKEGALSMQFFYSEHGVEVCEIAGRLFGYEHELVTYSCGLSIEELLLDYVYDPDQVRRTMQQHDPYFTRHCEGIYFVGKQDAVIADMSKLLELAKDPNVLESMIFYKDGETVDNYGPRSYLTRLYVGADTREELDRITQRMFEEIYVPAQDGSRVDYPFMLERD